MCGVPQFTRRKNQTNTKKKSAVDEQRISWPSWERQKMSKNYSNSPQVHHMIQLLRRILSIKTVWHAVSIPSLTRMRMTNPNPSHSAGQEKSCCSRGLFQTGKRTAPWSQGFFEKMTCEAGRQELSCYPPWFWPIWKYGSCCLATKDPQIELKMKHHIQNQRPSFSSAKSKKKMLGNKCPKGHLFSQVFISKKTSLPPDLSQQIQGTFSKG